jgi:hypothetical protein
MSFDLFVFDPTAAPRTPKHFLAWYDKQTDFKEGIDYNDSQNCTDELRAWFFQMLPEFPPMNGPHKNEAEWKSDVDRNWTDYAIGSSFIYAAFGWNATGQARRATHQAALDNGLGVFDVSEEPARVAFPGGAEFLVRQKPWWRFW